MERGGKRNGAGRPKGTIRTLQEKTLQRQSEADEMPRVLGGDNRWKWAIKEAVKNKDYRTVADIMKYWTDRAKGKAPQAVSLKREDPIVIQYLRDDPATPAVVTPDKPALPALDEPTPELKIPTRPVTEEHVENSRGQSVDQEKLRKALQDVSRGFKGQSAPPIKPGWANW